MPESATRPGQTALFVAVPTSEESFRAAWRRGSPYLREAYTDVASGWRDYAQTAEVMRSVLAECEALGASVILDATWQDLATWAGQLPVGVVVAHMDFPPLALDDILDPSAFLSLVEQGAEPEWSRIRAEAPPRPDLASAVKAINRLLEAALGELDAGPMADLREGRRRASYREEGFGLLRIDRPRIDELCGPSVVRESRGIELADGMISARRFADAIPLDYRGLIDLRMCNSISLGAALRRARPRLRAAVAREPTHPDAAAILCKVALAYMAEQARRSRPVSYEDVILMIKEMAR